MLIHEAYSEFTHEDLTVKVNLSNYIMCLGTVVDPDQLQFGRIQAIPIFPSHMGWRKVRLANHLGETVDHDFGYRSRPKTSGPVIRLGERGRFLSPILCVDIEDTMMGRQLYVKSAKPSQ